MALKRYTNANRFMQDDEETYSEEVTRLQDENGGVDPNEVPSEPNSNRATEEDTWKDRYGNLRRHSQTLNDEIKELKKEVANLRKGSVKPPKTDEEFKEWAEKYPESVAFFRTLVMKEFEDREDNSTSERLVELENKLATERAYNELVRRHPDFPKIQKDAKFHDWIKVRSEKNPSDWVYQALFHSIDVDSADEAITFYKNQNDIKPLNAKANEREAASSVNTQNEPTVPKGSAGKKKWKESEIERLSPKDFDKYEDEIMEAMAKGDIDMDVSGGAR